MDWRICISSAVGRRSVGGNLLGKSVGFETFWGDIFCFPFLGQMLFFWMFFFFDYCFFGMFLGKWMTLKEHMGHFMRNMVKLGYIYIYRLYRKTNGIIDEQNGKTMG